MNRISSRAALTLATVIALTAVACSSATPDTGLGDDSKQPTTPSKTTAPGKDGTTTDTSPTSPSAPSTPAGDANACGAKATAQECGECCAAAKPEAMDAADDAYFGCLCAAATCATACADSVCATAQNNNQPTAACETCLTAQEEACNTKAAAACDANPDCKAIEACWQASCQAIADKEDQAGGSGAGNGGGNLPAQLSARATPALRRQR